MPGPAAILKQLHHLRKLAADLDTKIEQAPRQLTAQKKKLANQEQAAAAAHEHLKQLALGIREKEVSIKATQTQIKKYEKQLDESGNKKEYDTLKLEISQELAHIAKLEDEILAAMTETEEKTALLPQIDQGLQKARADFEKFEKDLQERIERFKHEKARALEEQKAAETSLPAEVKPQYNRLIAAKGADCLAAVKNRTCTECYTEITAQMLSELKQEMFMLCKNCGRMLYLED